MSKSSPERSVSSPATAPPEVLTDRDLPELYATADATSLSAQRRFIRSGATQLVLLVVAAIGGATSVRLGDRPIDWAQVVAAAALFSAAILKTHTLTAKPDVIWYEARAAAESAKTLAWRYAVGGDPFPQNAPGAPDMDKLFLGRVREVLRPLRRIPLIPPTERVEQITEKMRRLRSRPLSERKRAYSRGRVADQRTWYTRKALWNERRARTWNVGMLAFEVAGGGAALLTATSIIQIDLLGITAAVVGTATAWLQTKQHLNLAIAYSVTGRELADIESLTNEPETEEAWAQFVANAEDAISREHTLWRASRVE